MYLEARVGYRLGLGVFASMRLADRADVFKNHQVYLRIPDSEKINAKNWIEVHSLRAKKGTLLEIVTDPPDEEIANKLKNFIEGIRKLF